MWVDNGGIFNMNSGLITDNFARESNGGGVAVVNGSTFNMAGGRIMNNQAPDGGTTDDSEEIQQGGGVLVSSGSTFIMLDGEISNNRANFGGGVAVRDGSEFRMTGGMIGQIVSGSVTWASAGNHVHNSGGGVFISDPDSVFSMSGGEVTGNSAHTVKFTITVLHKAVACGFLAATAASP